MPDTIERRMGESADVLGVTRVRLAAFSDGGLGDVSPGLLDAEIEAVLDNAALLVVFESGGVTGHPDHRAATGAARRVADHHGLPVLEWGVAPEVAAALNAELGTSFAPFDGFDGVDVVVDRAPQLAAIDCHESQARDNPVLVRRLQLQGPFERVRLCRVGPETPNGSAVV